MTLEEKLEKTSKIIENNLTKIGIITLCSGYFTLLFIAPVISHVKSKPKYFNLTKENIIYSVVAYKNGDTKISVYQKYTPPKELSMYENKFKVEKDEDPKFLKNCILFRKRIIGTPYTETYKTERRTEEYIMPTEKELNDCHNIN